jgi:hypothetical protein
LPLFNYTSDRQVFIDAAAGAAKTPVASHAMITSEFFDAMGIPFLEGRTIPPDLKPDDPQYIVINEALARHFWPGQSAIGRRLGVSDNATGQNLTIWREVIGVVGNVEPAANIGNPPTRFVVYRPLVQEPWSFVNLVVRSQNPAALVESVRRAVSEVDPDIPADEAGTVRQFVERTQHNIVVVSRMLGAFAILGLVLAAIGLYGVISNIVAQRTTEFGIRLALGAQPRDVVNHVVTRGLRLALVGVTAGLAGSYGLGRFLESTMPRLATPDPVALAYSAIVLVVVTLMACWLPARRATKVDPMTALRAE